MKRRTDQQNLGEGGKIWEVAREWNVSPRTILDFSAIHNPLGPSLQVMVAIAQAAVAYQPDDHECREALAKWCDVPRENLVLGNGNSSLVFAAVRALKPKTALIVEPAFGEYTRALHSVEANIRSFRVFEKQQFQPDFEKLRRDLKKDRFGVLILNSPHNPTGVAYPRKEILEVVRTARRSDTGVILDESFIDFQPDESLVRETAKERNLVVVRSLTAFFSIAGLRIGFAVATPTLIRKLQTQMERWSVSTVAMAAAIEAVRDPVFVRRSLAYNLTARAEFQAELTRIGCLVIPGAANFLLTRLPHGTATDFAAWLAPHHVLIRTGNSFVGLGDQFLRLAVRSREQNKLLVGLCEQWLSEKAQPSSKTKTKPKTAPAKKTIPPPKAKPKPTPSKKRLKKITDD